MKTPFKLTFLICSLLLASCTKRNAADKPFANYLSHSFGLQLEPALAYYILVPSNQCEGCILWDASKFSSASLSKKVTVISAFPKTHFKNFVHYLNDEKDEMLKLKFIQYRNCIVTTRNRHVVSVIPATNVYRQVDSLNEVFTK
jgi:hypothetical protein